MKKSILFVMLFLSITISAQEVIDKIAAVVDNEIILQSELDFQTAMFASQRQLDPKDPAIKDQLLNKLIEDKLLYAQSLLDSIEVTDEQIEGQLDYLINYYKQQYGSQKSLEDAYGMSVEKIKREMRDDTKKNLMADMLKNQKFGRIDVTRREVKEFFNTYKDSLGLISEKFEIAHVFINPKSSNKLKNKSRDYAQSILDSIKNGADFAELAKNISDDPGSKSSGGDLGFVKRGVFYPEFESAAFRLRKDELSKVIESPVGFHIIQMLERRGESIHTRHILLKPKSDNNADILAIERLTEIRDSIMNGTKGFEYYARKYSDDKQTSKF
ncbi:MAG: peptidylprolyl isomerase, partial [Melioribacteraceae bacterium]